MANSEFIVSRTAYKDNSSVYHLNGKKVLFREVATLLRGHGIDLDHNRFLILQVSYYICCVVKWELLRLLIVHTKLEVSDCEIFKHHDCEN